MTQRTARNTNRLLWTAQILLALLFLLAGAMKFVLPPEKMQGPIALPLAFVRFIGTAEVLGALGLILPGLLRIRIELTPLAAAGLVIIMTGATVLTIAGMGVAPALFPFIVGVIATTIAYGRWRIVPLPERSRQQILRAA
jgi:uncharacterized membrane protein YphA (DoxX/SURF4 family)